MTQSFLESSKFYFYGRPYAELLKCFGLAEAELIGKSVLECPSGPSSFVVEANQVGIRAIGVDPLFYRGGSAIRDLARADFRLMFDKMRTAEDRLVRRTYTSLDEAEVARREGLERFLADYAVGKALGRYRCGALPNLDFEDAAFDIVLCGHLLFVYDESLDLAFHLESVREMCRVAKEEVRAHPIVTAANEIYPHLEEVCSFANELGFDASIHDVDHEFFRGTNRTLTLRRRGLGASDRVV